MIIDHGKIHVSYKPIRFQMANSTVLISDGRPFFDVFTVKNADIKLVEKTKWFGLVTMEKELQVIGLKVGTQKIRWYYEDHCCSKLTADVHEITLVIVKESDSGEEILSDYSLRQNNYTRYRHQPNNQFHLVQEHLKTLGIGNQPSTMPSQFQQQQPFQQGPTREFLFFDEAFRLLDKIIHKSGGNGDLRELFCYLARNSKTGRIHWEELLGFFPVEWEPSYYHAVERIVQLMRQAMDSNHISQSELRTLIELSYDVIRTREFQLSLYPIELQVDMMHTVEFWKSITARLTAIANNIEVSIDDLAVSNNGSVGKDVNNNTKKSRSTGSRSTFRTVFVD